MAGILNWDLGDASNNVNSNSFSHTYSTAGNKTVNVYKGTATDASSIIGIDMNADNLVGTLNISNLHALSTLNVNTNASLNTITNPVSSIDVSLYYAYSCNLLGTLDVSGLTHLGGDFQVQSNTNMSGIRNPVSSKIFTKYYIDHCNINPTLDISGLTGLKGDIRLNNNANLKFILNPDSSQAITGYAANNCDLTGTLDLRSFNRLGGNISLGTNAHLNAVLNPSSGINLGTYDVHNCGLVGTLDVSGFGGGIQNFYCFGNPSLNTIINPSTADINSHLYDAHGCGLTGTLDWSGIKNFYGSFIVYNNPNLIGIQNPSSYQNISQYWAFDCSLNGTLDVSGFTGLSGNFQIQNNRTLTNLLLPNSFTKGGFTIFQINNCSLNTASIDAAFQKLSGVWDASVPSANTIINATGGGNSYLTDGSDNRYLCRIQNAFDGSSAFGYTINVIPEPYPNTADGSVNVIYFNNNAYVDFARHPDVSGYQGPISFRCYLDVSNYTSNETLIYHQTSGAVGDTNNAFIVFMDSSSMCFQFGTVDNSADGRINIAQFVNQKLFIEVEKIQTGGISKLGYVKVNGTSQPLTYNNSTVLGNFNAFVIGAVNNLGSYVLKANRMSIWDVRFPRRGHWKGGYVDASLNSSWVDTIRNVDGSLFGDVSTRKL